MTSAFDIILISHLLFRGCILSLNNRRVWQNRWHLWGLPAEMASSLVRWWDHVVCSTV